MTTVAEEREGTAPALVPARMLNEFTYCPRLAYLEWVEGDFADNADTVSGRHVHRRVDRESGSLPEPEEARDGEQVHARSLLLSAPKVGLVARIDVVEADGRVVTPVDYKRGKAPDVPGGAWEPERVQLCAQAMVLEENGYECPEGVLYFAGSRQRVTIEFDLSLRTRTLELLAEMRRSMEGQAAPPPLVDSPKCPRCSLVGICLPDEINMLRAPADEEGEGRARRLVPARDDAMPLYVQSAGARVGKSGEELVIEDRDGMRHPVRLNQTSHIAVFGAVQLSAHAIQAALGREIPVLHLSSGGWFYGMTVGMTHKNVGLRMRQFEVAADAGASLAIARAIVAGKIRNCRTLLRRNAEDRDDRDLARLKELARAADEASSSETLLGIEGTAARIYFGAFNSMLRPAQKEKMTFQLEGRNRRPPQDPVNCLLSFVYSLLTKEATLAALAVGFDPFLGFYHRPRYGRPALALDIMEEFRPIVGDSAVLSLVNTGAVGAGDFLRRGPGVSLTSAGRRSVIAAFERRMDELITHPRFGYRVSYRRIFEVQTRLLARHVAGELDAYPAFCTR